MPHKTDAEKAISLLELHNGSCFVPETSMALTLTFEEMEKVGLIHIHKCTVPVAGINVRSINFTPVVEPLDDEGQTY